MMEIGSEGDIGERDGDRCGLSDPYQENPMAIWSGICASVNERGSYG